MANTFSILDRAVSKSFDKISGSSSDGGDADLQLYEKLTPQALDVIAATYGPDGLLQYVTAMEAKRMKKGIPNA